MYNIERINFLKEYFISHHQTIAVAESVTSGHLQAALSLATDASRFFQGGISVYNIGQKSKHLNIEPIHALSCNSISEKVASEMATNVCRLFSSDYGIGITGYASPAPEFGVTDELFAFFSIAFKGKELFTKKIVTDKNDVLEVQLFYVERVLKELEMTLRKPKVSQATL